MTSLNRDLENIGLGVTHNEWHPLRIPALDLDWIPGIFEGCTWIEYWYRQAVPMTSNNILSSLFLALSAVAIVINFKRKYIAKGLPLPPGPPADPIIGHIRSMPRLYPWKTFSEWGSRWGECFVLRPRTGATWLFYSGGLIYIHVFGTPMIIINDLAVARELLDKRSSIYSDRPRYVLFCEMFVFYVLHVQYVSQSLTRMGWENILAFIPYGDRFRKHRKMIQQHFNSQQAVLRFREVQRSEICVLLLNLLQSPKDFDCHIKRSVMFEKFPDNLLNKRYCRAVAGTLLGVAYGHQVTSDDDEFVTLIEKAAVLSVAPGAPGTTPPDFLPFCRSILIRLIRGSIAYSLMQNLTVRHVPSWLPGAGLQRHAMKTKKLVGIVTDAPYELVKQNKVWWSPSSLLSNIFLTLPGSGLRNSETIIHIVSSRWIWTGWRGRPRPWRGCQGRWSGHIRRYNIISLIKYKRYPAD